MRIWSSTGDPRSSRASAMPLNLWQYLVTERSLCTKVVEGSIKVKSMCLMITEELVLQGEPQVAHGMTTLSNDLLKIGSDHVGEPAEDDSVHLGPCMIVGEGVVGEDVVGEGVSCQGHQHQVMPDSVVSITMFTNW
jgi:hypothetical protein